MRSGLFSASLSFGVSKARFLTHQLVFLDVAVWPGECSRASRRTKTRRRRSLQAQVRTRIRFCQILGRYNRVFSFRCGEEIYLPRVRAQVKAPVPDAFWGVGIANRKCECDDKSDHACLDSVGERERAHCDLIIKCCNSADNVWATKLEEIEANEKQKDSKVRANLFKSSLLSRETWRVSHKGHPK